MEESPKRVGKRVAGEGTGGTGSTVRPDRLLSIRDVAEWLQVPVQTLYRWRYLGEGPLTLKMGKHLRYRAGDVEAWLETCR
jgi:excisionase family DNA binding protein